MGGLARIKKAYVAAHKGCVSRGVPRIYNVDKGIEIVGFAEIKQGASNSLMGRVKTHQGFFYCADTDIEDGDLIQDRQDNRYYLVMSAKIEAFNYETIYIDSPLFFCDNLISVSRFSAEGTRDGFGRPVAAAPVVIATDIRCMANAMNFDIMQQPDRLMAHDKIKFYVQRKVGIKVADRITDSSGDNFIVESVDNVSLTNLSLLGVDSDVR